MASRLFKVTPKEYRSYPNNLDTYNATAALHQCKNKKLKAFVAFVFVNSNLRSGSQYRRLCTYQFLGILPYIATEQMTNALDISKVSNFPKDEAEDILSTTRFDLCYNPFTVSDTFTALVDDLFQDYLKLLLR